MFVRNATTVNYAEAIPIDARSPACWFTDGLEKQAGTTVHAEVSSYRTRLLLPRPGRCRCNKIRENIFVSIGNGMRINPASSSGDPKTDPRRYDASPFYSRHFSFLLFLLSLSRFFSSSTFTRSRALASFTRAIKSATAKALSAARENDIRAREAWIVNSGRNRAFSFQSVCMRISL